MQQEKKNQLFQEATRAAIVHFELNPMRSYQPTIQELELSEQERERYVHKLYIIIADYAAIVYQLAPGQYQVEDRPNQDDQSEEAEAHRVLMTAARYLEINIRQARQVEASEERPPEDAAYSARWRLTIDGQTCTVARYDRQDGPDYQIREEA